jgi:SAM-dependent methyltransferase
MRELLLRLPGAMPYRFQTIRRRFGARPFALLDIGAGNHSAALARRWFPACRYTGVDRDRDYHNDPADFEAMDAFFELDLTTLAFDALPDGAFDVILMAHVVEHLHNGDEVVRALCPKLKPGGMFYLEFPAPRSLHFPSMKGTLNFKDDLGHVRLWTTAEIETALRAGGLRIVKAGTRRDPLRALLTPLRVLVSLATGGFVAGGVFWDLLGFADMIVAERPAD